MPASCYSWYLYMLEKAANLSRSILNVHAIWLMLSLQWKIIRRLWMWLTQFPMKLPTNLLWNQQRPVSWWWPQIVHRSVYVNFVVITHYCLITWCQCISHSSVYCVNFADQPLTICDWTVSLLIWLKHFHNHASCVGRPPLIDDRNIRRPPFLPYPARLPHQHRATDHPSTLRWCHTDSAQ